MDYPLIIAALEKHVRMAQAAVDFGREQQKGAFFLDALKVLEEATRALEHVRREQRKKWLNG